MSDVNKANAILAKACGVEIDADYNWFTILSTKPDEADRTWCYEWTIEDARCREIVRERFGLITIQLDPDTWCCVRNEISGEGKTIAEAEISCLLAIADELEGEDE